MLSTYIRKKAQGKKYYVVGYWCQFCDQWLSENEWLPHQKGVFEGAALWSFQKWKAYIWLDFDEYLEKMMEIHTQKLKSLEEKREEVLKKRSELLSLWDDHITILKRRINGLQRKMAKRKREKEKINQKIACNTTSP